MAGRSSFLVYLSYSDSVNLLTDEEAGIILKSMLQYASGEEPFITNGKVQILFSVMKSQYDRDNEKYILTCERRKAAAQKRYDSANAHNSMQLSQMHAIVTDKDKEEEEDKEKDKEEDKDSPKGEIYKNDGAKAPRTRHKYGQYENVLLSDEELEKLKKEFPFDWEERIERVSSYVAATGKKYKNFLATIRNWANRDKEKQKEEDGKWAVTPPEEQMPYPWEVE